MPGHWEFGYFDPGLVVETPAPPAGAIPIGRTLHTWGSLPWGVGVWLGGTSGLVLPAVARVSDDVDFLGGLIHRVAVEVDVNAPGLQVDGHAGRAPDWDPLTGLDAVPCLICWKDSSPYEGDARPGQARTGRVLFGRSLVADRRNRLVYDDPDFGIMHIYLTGPVRVSTRVAHHWIADVRDRPF